MTGTRGPAVKRSTPVWAELLLLSSFVKHRADAVYLMKPRDGARLIARGFNGRTLTRDCGFTRTTKQIASKTGCFMQFVFGWGGSSGSWAAFAWFSSGLEQVETAIYKLAFWKRVEVVNSVFGWWIGIGNLTRCTCLLAGALTFCSWSRHKYKTERRKVCRQS